MSLILDALRKMEQDRKSRRGPVDIRPDVLRYRTQAKRQKRKQPLVVAICVILVAAVLGAGMYLAGERRAVLAMLNSSPAAPAPMAAATPGQVPAQAVAPQPAPAPVAAAPAAPAPAAPQPVAAPQPPAAAGSPSGHPAPAPASVAAAATGPSARTAHARRAGTVGQVSQRNGSEEGAGTVPDISISGIAWQEERNLRRAVLNGSLVAEGADVAGARVVEIKEDRVRLSRGGQIFDVLFSSGLSSR